MIDRRLKNTKILISVSGGKDSTAMVLHMIERGFSWDQMEMIYMDTGWEHLNTYKYLDYLERFFEKEITRLRAKISIKEEHKEFVFDIEKRLGFESPFVRQLMNSPFFPNARQKWCTKSLKLDPFKKYIYDIEDDYVSLVGIRREESKRRSKFPEWEWSDNFDCWVWRPLIDWSEKYVIDIHQRNGILPNSLYLNGHNRVGCWPCIYANKSLISILDENRISIIRDLEKYIGKHPKRKNPNASFFHPNASSNGDIDSIIAWSQTARGGRQMPLFNLEPPTCEKWGLCEFK